MEPIPIDSMNLLSRLGKGSENHSIQNFTPGDPMFTLTKGHHHAVAQPIPIQDTRPMEKKQNGLGIGSTGDVAYTLDTTGAQGVAQPIAMRESGPGFWMEDTKAGTLRAEGENRPSRPSHVIGVVSPTVTTCKGSRGGSSSEAIDELIALHQAQSMNEEEPITFQPGNLRRQAGAAPSTEVFPTLKCDTGDQSPHICAPTLTASNDPSRSPQSSEVTQQVHSVHQVTMAVRRLTPRECERLQGFPDDWSKIPWKGKSAEECPDGPRYKACGNSMAVPCMRWIGEQIDKKHKELFGTP